MRQECRMVIFILLTCTSVQSLSQSEKGETISSLRFLSEYIIPYNYSFDSTVVGGLSGIDYNRKENIYYLISDDRSAVNPARFYTALINVSPTGVIQNVNFVSTHYLRAQDGSYFPSLEKNPSLAIDPESIRHNPVTKQISWVSEGEKVKAGDAILLADPSINISDLEGRIIATLPLPENLKMIAGQGGPRRNSTLESLTFANNYEDIYVALEEPLTADGPRPSISKSNSWSRIYKFNIADGGNKAQLAYHLESVAWPPTEGGYFVNGICEILSIDESKLLIIERSFSTGRLPCTIKVFVADISNASDVSKIHSLELQPPLKPVTKKLLLNMDDLNIHIDNIEGVTFGPTLANGHRTLIFVSDNNFQDKQKTQLLLFEIIP